MSERELNRVEILAQVDDGRLSLNNAANMLAQTRRQIFRLLKQYRQIGASAIRYKARGHPQTIVSTRPNAPAHCRRSKTVTRISVRSRPLKCQMFHQFRLRRECFGELIQIDGSDHRWFEGRTAAKGQTCQREERLQHDPALPDRKALEDGSVE